MQITKQFVLLPLITILTTVVSFSQMKTKAPNLSLKTSMSQEVGTKLPAITLRSVDGSLVDLNAMIKDKPSILIIYRGGLCVYWNTQMGQLHNIVEK